MNNIADEEEKPHYIVSETDRFDADRETAFLRLVKMFGPEFANAWLKGLTKALNALP